MSAIGIVLAFFIALFVLMSLGIPVAYAFLIVNAVAMWLLVGFDGGMSTLVSASYESVASFSLAPIPLFIFMGEVLSRSGCVTMSFDAIGKMLGRMPGRLSVLSILAGTVFAATSGSTVANASMLGSMLLPDMRRRGYAKSMIIGPILGAGSLAMIIPPSGVAVLLGGIAQISVADLLIGGIVPGICMAAGFLLYIMIRCALNPALAPIDEGSAEPFGERLKSLVVHVLPLALLVFAVLGAILFGIATPTESAALGVLAAFIVAAAYRRLSFRVVVDSVVETVQISAAILLIVALATGFAQALSLSGASRAVVTMVQSLDLTASQAVLIMLAIVLVLGAFLELVAVMLICMPLFMPVVMAHQIDPVWFGLMVLICLDVGQLTPPFGMLLFVMKSVVPKEVKMSDIILASQPFVAIELLIVVLLFLFPQFGLYLPGVGD